MRPQIQRPMLGQGEARSFHTRDATPSVGTKHMAVWASEGVWAMKRQPATAFNPTLPIDPTNSRE